MKVPNGKLSLALFLSLTLTVNSAFASQFSQHTADVNDDVPSGDWSISSLPYLGPGYESMPVRVISVTTSSVKGVKISKVGILNQTPKTLVGVRFKWELSTEQSPEKILLSGETPLVGISVSTEEKRAVDFPVFSLGKVSKSLLKEGSLKGSYQVVVAVTEILFEDGSSWKWGDSSFSKIKAKTSPASQSGCAFQKCTTIGKGRDTITHLCDSSRGVYIYCRNEGTQCTNVTCH